MTPLDAPLPPASRRPESIPTLIESMVSVLTPAQYAERTILTAHYPGAGTGDHRELAHLGLGLNNKAGELLGKLASRGTPNSVPGVLVEIIIDEIGEVYWHAARLTVALRGEPTWSLGTLPPRKVQPTSTIVALELGCQCGLASGAVKKLLRGDPHPDNLRDRALVACREASIRLSWLAEAFGGSREIAMARNLDKFMDRQQRGVIKCSGDAR